jgi:anti-sigma factor (TIGR02949 family)
MPEDPMRCSVAEAQLSALVDGELTEAQADELRRHVAGCARCAERVAAFERAGALLSALPARPVPSDLRARLQTRIEADATEAAASAPARRTPPRSAPPPRRRWLGSPALAAAAAMAAAVAFYWVLAPAERVGPGSEIEPPPIAREDPSPAPTFAPDLEPGVQEPPIAATPPEPEAPRIAVAPGDPATEPDSEFDPVPAEEIAVALELEQLEQLEELDVIANLELLEALVALGEGTG